MTFSSAPVYYSFVYTVFFIVISVPHALGSGLHSILKLTTLPEYHPFVLASNTAFS